MIPVGHARTYVKTKVQNYSQGDLRAAVKNVNDGMSIYSAAKSHGISRETLRRHVEGLNVTARVGSGRSTVLTEEEGLIVSTLCYLTKMGFPVDRKDVSDIMKSYVEHAGKKVPWRGGLGKDWMLAFEKR